MIKRRTCTVKDNPPNTYGDCVAQCINMLTDRDDAPHIFAQGFTDPVASWNQMRQYLAGHGKTLFVTHSDDDPREWMKLNNAGIPYMLMCQSAGGDHAVVCIGDEVHNPAWYTFGIDGPLSQGFYIIGIVGVLP